MSCCDEKNESKITQLSLDGLICYCFKHSKKELFKAIQNNKQNEILDDIKAKMKDPGCFCETANPSGECCLGDVKKFIEMVESE